MKNYFFSAIIVPLSLNSGWKTLEYRGIRPNEVVFNQNGLKININHSASPLFYLFDRAKIIESFSIKVNFASLPKFQESRLQGSSGNDDYALRVGFVEKGSVKLNVIERLIAPRWVKILHEQFSQGQGIGKIYFYNFTQNKDQLGLSRIHPNSNLINETFAYFLENVGEVALDYKLPKKIEALGLWISADGDDAKSTFSLDIKDLKLNAIKE